MTLKEVSFIGVSVKAFNHCSLWQCVSLSTMMEDLGISLQCYKGIRRRSRPHSAARSACIFCQPKLAAKREGRRRDSSTWAMRDCCMIAFHSYDLLYLWAVEWCKVVSSSTLSLYCMYMDNTVHWVLFRCSSLSLGLVSALKIFKRMTKKLINRMKTLTVKKTFLFPHGCSSLSSLQSWICTHFIDIPIV